MGQLLVVDKKHRVTLPRELRKRLGIKSGSRLEAVQKGSEILIRPVVPVKNPTDAIWGLAAEVVDRNPKRQAREAIAKRSKLGK